MSLPRDELLERRAQPLALVAQPVADRSQRRAGVVEHLARCIDGAPDRGDFVLEARDARDDRRRGWETTPPRCARRRAPLDRIDEVGQRCAAEADRAAGPRRRARRASRADRCAGAQRKQRVRLEVARSSRSWRLSAAPRSRGRCAGSSCSQALRAERRQGEVGDELRRCDRIRACGRRAWSGEPGESVGPVDCGGVDGRFALDYAVETHRPDPTHQTHQTHQTYRLQVIDHAGDAAGAEPVVDVHHRHAVGAGVEHAEQRRDAAEAGAVADAGRHARSPAHPPSRRPRSAARLPCRRRRR